MTFLNMLIATRWKATCQWHIMLKIAVYICEVCQESVHFYAAFIDLPSQYICCPMKRMGHQHKMQWKDYNSSADYGYPKQILFSAVFLRFKCFFFFQVFTQTWGRIYFTQTWDTKFFHISSVKHLLLPPNRFRAKGFRDISSQSLPVSSNFRSRSFIDGELKLPKGQMCLYVSVGW